MDEDSFGAIKRDRVKQLGRVMLSNASPPPWVSDNFDSDAAAALVAEFVETMRDMYDELGRPGPDELEVLQFVFYRAATWGWDAAMNNGPTAQRNAMLASAAARKAKAEESRAKVIAAFERAIAAGSEPDIDAIAKDCGVSKSTAYRALADRM